MSLDLPGQERDKVEKEKPLVEEVLEICEKFVIDNMSRNKEDVLKEVRAALMTVTAFNLKDNYEYENFDVFATIDKMSVGIKKSFVFFVTEDEDVLRGE